MTPLRTVCQRAVLEFVEGGWIFEGCGPPGGIGEAKARQYLRDVVAGLMYLHEHVQSTYNQAFSASWLPSDPAL